MAAKTYYNWFKKYTYVKTIVFFEYDVAKHRFGGQIGSKTRGYVNSIPAFELFLSSVLRETDGTSVINIRTKGEGLKRLRSREISC